MTDAVALLLKELRLPAFRRHYRSLWQTAVDKSWSHTDYLAALCEYELSDRYQRRTQQWLREAKIATNKTFSALDQSRFSPPCKTALAKLQQDSDWAHRADNVLLIGPSGTGKQCLGSPADRTGCALQAVLSHGAGTTLTAGQARSRLDDGNDAAG